MPKIHVNDFNMYYEVYGSGEPILLIMGLGGSMVGWQSQIPTLSQHLRVIAFDNRGSGRSDMPEMDYSMGMFADDAAGLLHALDFDSAHVFGVSMGGMIAQEVALRHPSLVRSLILGATSPCPLAMPPRPEAFEATIKAQEMEPRQAFEATFWTGYSEAYLAANEDLLWQRAQVEKIYSSPPAFWRRHYDATVNHDTRERLGDIAAPTLITGGEDDPLMPPEASRYLAEHIPNAELILFPGARHSFNVELADETNRAVLDFVRRHSGAPSENTPSGAARPRRQVDARP
jgi:pimeloyl-ACP methyl ester carboxylesterase